MLSSQITLYKPVSIVDKGLFHNPVIIICGYTHWWQTSRPQCYLSLSSGRWGWTFCRTDSIDYANNYILLDKIDLKTFFSYEIYVHLFKNFQTNFKFFITPATQIRRKTNKAVVEAITVVIFTLHFFLFFIFSGNLKFWILNALKICTTDTQVK